MGNLAKKQSKLEHGGMTLIEVLIALAIVGIAMTAIIKASIEIMRATNYLQDKTIAMWVAEKKINEIKLHLLSNLDGDALQPETMLNREWYWRANIEKTALAQVQKITVAVYRHQNDADPILEMEGFSVENQT